MRRRLFLPLVVLVGCSGPTARPEAESWPARPVLSGATSDQDTIAFVPAAGEDADAPQPAVVFHCEDGRLGAYLVPGGSGEAELGGEQMVPIILDSAPSC